MSERIGKYKLGKVLISSEKLVERRALEMDPGGTPIRVVSVCGLRVGAASDAMRGRLVEKLRDWQKRVALPHTAKIIEVLDHTEAPEFDAVVVSELTPGRPLTDLAGRSGAPPLDPTLWLYVVRTLCETVTASQAGGKPPAPLATLDADSVWIDRQATVTVHNPFLGLALSLVRDGDAARPDDVVAMQALLRQVSATADDVHDPETPAARAVADLLELERRKGEGGPAFIARFSKTVKRLAGEHGVSQAGGVASLTLAALEGVFDTDSRRVDPSEPPRPLEVDRSEGTGHAGALSDFAPETDVEVDLSDPPGPGMPATAPVPMAPPHGVGDHLHLDRWVRYAVGTVAGLVLVGLGMVLANGVPAWSRSPADDSNAAEGYLDLRSIDISPADARLYLSISGSDRVVRLPAGVHELEIRADGHETRRLTIDVVPGEAVSIPGVVALSAGSSSTRGWLDLTGVTTVPGDAQITVDGEPVAAGTTEELPAGSHTLSFVRNGYVTQTRDVVIEAGGTATVDGTVTLSAAIRPGTINVGSPVAVEIFEDGTRLGVAPYAGRFPPGPHVLEFRHDGLSTRLGYQVAPFETIDITMQLTRVNSTPFSDVAIRVGETLVAAGSTPGRVLVPVGAALVFSHPELGQREVVPEPGQDAVSVSFAAP